MPKIKGLGQTVQKGVLQKTLAVIHPPYCTNRSPSVSAGPQATSTFYVADLFNSPYSKYIMPQICSVSSVSVQRIELSNFLTIFNQIGQISIC